MFRCIFAAKAAMLPAQVRVPPPPPANESGTFHLIFASKSVPRYIRIIGYSYTKGSMIEYMTSNARMSVLNSYYHNLNSYETTTEINVSLASNKYFGIVRVGQYSLLT
jgi:hypothetical protein